MRMRNASPETGRQSGPALGDADLAPYLAGQIGQATLDRLGGRAHPELDQHIAAVRDAAAEALGPQAGIPAELTGFLVRYASGFVSAATAGGWRPEAEAGRVGWESMRLAAVCVLAGEPGKPGQPAPPR